MKIAILGVCVACALTGCAGQNLAPVTQKPVTADVLSSVDKIRLADSMSTVTIRSFRAAETTDKDAKPQELVGVPCNVDSDEVRAKVVTPQAVVVPNFKQRAKYPNRGLPSALIITCDTGKLRGVGSIASKEKQITSASGGGLAVALITVAASAAIANSTPWVYSPLAHVRLDEE